MMSFAKRLRALRNARNLTQQEVANRLGIHRSTYAKYETGDNEPDHETLQRLADFFDVSVDYLLGHSEGKDSTGHIPREKAGFLRWAEENLEDVFFYEFNKSPDEQKAELMDSIGIAWEVIKRRVERELAEKKEQEGDKHER